MIKEMLEKFGENKKLSCCRGFEKLCRKNSAVLQKPKSVFTRHSDNSRKLLQTFWQNWISRAISNWRQILIISWWSFSDELLTKQLRPTRQQNQRVFSRSFKLSRVLKLWVKKLLMEPVIDQNSLLLFATRKLLNFTASHFNNLAWYVHLLKVLIEFCCVWLVSVLVMLLVINMNLPQSKRVKLFQQPVGKINFGFTQLIILSHVMELGWCT